MAKRRYDIIFSPEVSDHLNAIDVKFHSLILEKIDEQLQHEPNVETRNRKRLRAPAAYSAEWEIRLVRKTASACCMMWVKTNFKFTFWQSARR